jgi:serine phosphatase RsbU (regulator of sigma subunit)/tetratricopeptide (TPR) repeat protein
MRNTLFVFLLLVVFLPSAWAQQSVVERFMEVKEKAEKSISKGDFEASIKMCEELEKVAEESKNDEMRASSALVKGRALLLAQKEEEAYSAFMYALQVNSNESSETKKATAVWLVNILNKKKLYDLVLRLADRLLPAFRDDQQNYLMLMKEIASAARYSALDNRFDYLNQYLQIAETAGGHVDKRLANEWAGQAMMQKNDFSGAVSYYSSALEWAKKTKEGIPTGTLYNNIAYSQLQNNQASLAIDNFKSAQAYLPTDHVLSAEIWLNLSAAYLALGNTDEALRAANKAVEQAERLKKERIIIRGSLARAYLYMQRGEKLAAFDEVQRVETRAAKNRITEFDMEFAKFYTTYFGSKNDRENERYFKQKEDKLRAEANDKNIADIQRLKQLEKVYIGLEQAVFERLTQQKEEELRTNFLELDSKNKEQSIQLLKAEQELIASEFNRANAEKERAMRELEIARLALEQQQSETEISSLQNEKTSQELALTQLQLEKSERETALFAAERRNLEFEKQDLLSKEEMRKQALQRWLWIGVSLISCVALLIAFLIVRRLKDKNSLIKSQHTQLQEKNNDLLSSITAASHFQQALTPDAALFANGFRDGFLFYKPLDKVSGDLPFFHRNKQVVWLAAIDCIGHGVPAAMLTFTAHYTLLGILQRFPEWTPGQVLQELHTRIIRSLLSDDDQQKFNSGMDIAIVKIDEKNDMLYYAGAMSPLAYINTLGEMNVIRATRCSVADFNTQEGQVFATHELDTKNIKRFFLYSDGITHQLSEKQSKIFSSKRFLKLLSDNSGKSMHDLMALLHQEHSLWKGNAIQTDDMLVIGIEL